MPQGRRLKGFGGGYPTPQFLSYRTFQESLNQYAFVAQFTKNKLVLDVGSGTGLGSVYLRRNGTGRVVAGDMSLSAILCGSSLSLFPGGEVEFTALDATNLPFKDGCFDAVVTCELIEHVRDYRRLLRECRRVLKVDGFFFCSTPNKQAVSPSKPVSSPFHVREFYTDEFVDLLHLYFEQVELWGQGNWERAKMGKKLAVALKEPLLHIPKAKKLVNLITTFIFREYRLLRTEEVKALSADMKYQPFLLRTSKIVPVSVIAVARKKEGAYAGDFTHP